MGKGTDLWDDSVLINAFDHAMASYKEMHSNVSHGYSAKDGNSTGDKSERDLLHNEKETLHIAPEANSNATENCVRNDNAEDTTDNLCDHGSSLLGDVHPSESEPCSSGLLCTDGEAYNYSEQQNADYNELLRQYYELEDQKQKVAQQLHQANYWNNQTPPHSSACHLPQPSSYGMPEQCVQTCSLCSCHCIAIPLAPTACTAGALPLGSYSCSSQSACCLSSQTYQVSGSHYTADSCQHPPAAATATATASGNTEADDCAIEVGVLAVERALSSMKEELLATCGAGKENGREGSNALSDGNASQHISSDKDLAAVLNAWYMAGFHTGRYLSGHSKKNAH